MYMNFLKKNKILIIVSILVVALDVFHGNFALTPILAYVIIIKLLLSGVLKENARRILAVIVWVLVVFLLILSYCVNHSIIHISNFPNWQTLELLWIGLVVIGLVLSNRE